MGGGMPDLHYQSLAGIAAILVLAWALSENRRAFPVRTVVVGLALQFALALLLLKVTPARNALFSLNGVVDALMKATKAGTAFVFGYVGGAAARFAVTNASGMTSFAFEIMPLVIVNS